MVSHLEHQPSDDLSENSLNVIENRVSAPVKPLFDEDFSNRMNQVQLKLNFHIEESKNSKKSGDGTPCFKNKKSSLKNELEEEKEPQAPNSPNQNMLRQARRRQSGFSARKDEEDSNNSS